MSRTESRRPIRVLSADEIALLRQQQNQAPRSAAQLAALQSADRFRRTLAGPSRRAEAAAPAASPRPAPPTSAPPTSLLPSSAQPHPAQPAKAGAGLALHAVVQELPANDEPAATEPLLAADTQWLALAAHQLPDGEAGTAALTDGLAVPELPRDPWPEQMAHTIAGLCARAEPAFVNWTVTLPMDPQVLPETDLRLSLSQHWLSLRFITQSPRSHHLVCRYRQSLLAELERLPNLPHGIDIEVT
jgi:hypothetical protein